MKLWIAIAVLAAGIVFKDEIVTVLFRHTRETAYATARLAQAENEGLKARIAALEERYAAPRKDDITAQVFAAYPFNNQNALIINKGARAGIRRGMPATLTGGMFIGIVDEVFQEWSSVRTVKSPDMELPVRIGLHKVPGLLVGGPTPRITMIPGDAKVAFGDRIITASPDIPYGLAVGTVSTAHPDSATGVFQEAMVSLVYRMNDITEVVVMLWTKE